MSLTGARSKANNAAELARSEGNEALAQLAEAISELARGVGKEMDELKRDIETIRRRQG